MYKNVANQKITIYAFDTSTNLPKTGDAANITASISKDGASGASSNDVNPTELGGGIYVFDLTQAETNCDMFTIYASSSTSNVQIVPKSLYTNPTLVPFISGFVNDGAAGTSSFVGDSGLSAINNAYNDMILVFISGTLQGIGRKISAYNGSAKLISLSVAFPSAPANSDQFIIIGFVVWLKYMNKIIISPYSRSLRVKDSSGQEKNNPKNYCYWEKVISDLRRKGYYIIQVGVSGEKKLDVDEVVFDLSLKDLKKILLSSLTWVSVDNFFNHFASFYKKKGVVVFGITDPNIYGYSQNINLLKDNRHIHCNQFCRWDNVDYNRDVFIEPEKVVLAIESIIKGSK